MIRQTDLTPGQWARFYQAEQATGRPVSELLADFVLDQWFPAPSGAPSRTVAFMA